MRKFTNEDLARPLNTEKEGSQVKVYDSGVKRVPGLYASRTKIACRFMLKYRFAGRRECVEIGVLDMTMNPETAKPMFGIVEARAKAMVQLGKISNDKVNVGKEQRMLRTTSVEQARDGLTFNAACDMWIAAISTLEEKPDGELRPITESWANTASALKPARAAFGGTLLNEVTAKMIRDVVKALYADTTGRKKGGKVRRGNAVRTAVYGLFKWAASEDLATANPAAALGKRRKTVAKERALSADEVRAVWHALDTRTDLHFSRGEALGLQLVLCTGLRPGEVASLRRDEVVTVDGRRELHVHPRHVKKRRPIYCPLNSLASEIVDELLAMPANSKGMLFPLGGQGKPMTAQNLARVLAGRNVAKRAMWVGLCEALGMEPATPHDFRRTSTTLLGQDGASNPEMERVLDHQPSDAGSTLSVYNRAAQLAVLKVPTLARLDVILRAAITGTPVPPKATANVAELLAALSPADRAALLAQLQAAQPAAANVVPLRRVA